jgi:TolB-like protein/Tfp pilus assembly protein PilF
MPATASSGTDQKFEIGHILFIDIVGYSKLRLDEQRRLIEALNRGVRESREFQNADADGKLVRLPTGDGMALVFYNAPEAPVECALEIGRSLKQSSELAIRMGIHSGPVGNVVDVNDRRNIAGAGINMAQRVMDCGDAGHILLSKRAAEDLIHAGKWQDDLHDLGDCKVKHGATLSIFNLCVDGIGNCEVPSKLKQAREQEAAARRAVIIRQRRRISAIGAAVLFVAMSVAVWLMLRRSTSNLVSKSIAVLPFENVGDDKENAYLADGVQDEILTDLTKVADLKVISRRSVSQYRDTKQTIRQIGQALGVAHVLEGTVRKVAGRVHVTAQLIDTRNETQTWAEKYDRDIADVFQIQNDISQAIVTQLKAALSPAEKAAVDEKPTQDKEAYDLYLRARALIYAQGSGLTQRMADENAAKAVGLLESAIARDSKFALAYCALADAHLSLEKDDKAKEAIDAAIRIFPNLAEAHLILARYFVEGVEDISAGEKELTLAAVGLPGRVDVFNLRAEVEAQRGQWKEALHDREKASELDPQNLDTIQPLIYLNVILRRYDNAERLVDRTLATAPQQSTSLFWRCKSHIALARGDTKAAMTALDSSPMRQAGLYNFNHLVAHVFTLERNYAKAEEILQSAEEMAKTHKMLARTQERNESFRHGVQLEKLGRIARFRGEQEKAHGYFDAARPEFEEWLAKNPASITHNPLLQSHSSAYIAEIDAALSRKEDAIREGRNVAELWPLHRNARMGPNVHIIVAVAYMWSGERDAALQELAEVAKVPVPPPDVDFFQGLSAGELKLNPIWDPLRNDPRFDKIIAEAGKPIKIN